MIQDLRPGALGDAVDRAAEQALRAGSLLPIRTEQRTVEQAGVHFVVRSVSSLARKEADKRLSAAAGEDGTRPVNPFLPPEPELTVCALGGTHLAVLNKFNVLDRHLLLVTRRFEHQESLLTEADFHALCLCLAEYDALGFYNGGVVAGASQPHKHLQVVPLPLIPGGDEVPVTPLLAAAPADPSPGLVPGFPFQHAFARLAISPIRIGEAARATWGLYRSLLRAVGIGERPVDGESRQSSPYNLLLTRRWMLVVPRSAEFWEGISVNALGFAGSLFVRDMDQLETVRRRGPFAVLSGVGMPLAAVDPEG